MERLQKVIANYGYCSRRKAEELIKNKKVYVNGKLITEMGVKVFGEEMAKNVLAHAQDIKAKGAKYCDCPACKAVADILAKKEQML